MSGALVLIGLSGSGKSTVGHGLAHRLALPLLDTDRLVEEREGRTIADLFAALGEPDFRRREAAIVQEACAACAVVATGGGAVLLAANRRAMRRRNFVVWLDLPLHVLAQRLAAHVREEERPLLRGDVVERLHTLWEQRHELYERTAHLRVSDQPYAYGGSHAIIPALVEAYHAWEKSR